MEEETLGVGCGNRIRTEHKVLNSVTTEEVIEKPTTVIAERLLPIPKLQEVSMGEAACTKEFIGNKQDVGA